MPGKRTRLRRRDSRRGWTAEQKLLHKIFGRSDQSPRVFRKRMKRVERELHRRGHEIVLRELRNPAFPELFSGVLDDYMMYQQLPAMSLYTEQAFNSSRRECGMG